MAELLDIIALLTEMSGRLTAIERAVGLQPAPTNKQEKSDPYRRVRVLAKSGNRRAAAEEMKRVSRELMRAEREAKKHRKASASGEQRAAR